MVILIEELHRKKKYRIESLFLAVSLADRYLIHLAISWREAPCLVNLAVTCLLIAAKLTQPLRPKLDLMNALLYSGYRVHVKKQDFISLEKDILKALQFDLQFISPIFFLERYQRVFGVDLEDIDITSRKIGRLARDFCFLMQRDADFLQFRPSQIAATSLVFAVKTYYYKQSMANTMSLKDISNERDNALKMWTPAIEEMTHLSARDEIKPVFRILSNKVRKSKID